MWSLTFLTSSLLLAAHTVADGISIKERREWVESLSSRRLSSAKGLHNGVFTARGNIDSTMFLNSNTSRFAVNGSAIPDVDFDIGESYAGSLPISDRPEERSSLFFWFFPSRNPVAEKEIVIWLNGGPGCSSLEGLLQENGPFLWQFGTFKPVENPWGWNKLTNMIWVEQPVGTGFSKGTVTATDETEVAAQFNGFWKNFVDTFGIYGYKVYIAGESYAGQYCPYIASAMLDTNNTDYFDLSGMMIYDPVIGNSNVQETVPLVQFTEFWAGLFPFNDTFRAHINKRDAECGHTKFVEENLVYPPKGLQVPPNKGGVGPAYSCFDLFADVYEAASLINPCFNVYHVSTTCPVLWDVLGFPGSSPYTPEGASIYFNRTEVKNAIHAPLDVDWELCTRSNVFVGGVDSSPPSSYGVLPHVIDATQNVIIAHGALDMVLLANGTLLAIQNMTWGGKLGFQRPPTEPFYVPYSSISDNSIETMAAAGVFGTTHTERGLTYVGVAMAGHMIPQYAPSAAYRQLEFLLGRVNCLNCTVPFSTEMGATPQDVGPLGSGTAPQGWSSGIVSS